MDSPTSTPLFNRSRYFPPPFRIDSSEVEGYQDQEYHYDSDPNPEYQPSFQSPQPYSIPSSSRSSPRAPPRKKPKRLLQFRDPSSLEAPSNLSQFNPDGSENFEWKRFQSSLKLKRTWQDIYDRFKDAHLVGQDEIWLGRRRNGASDSASASDSRSDEEISSGNEAKDKDGIRTKKGKGKGKKKRNRKKDEEMRIIKDRGTLRNIQRSIQFGDFIEFQDEEDQHDGVSHSQLGDSKSGIPKVKSEEEEEDDDGEEEQDDEDELNEWNHGNDSFLLNQYTEFKRRPDQDHFHPHHYPNHQRYGSAQEEADEREEEKKSLELAMKLNPDLREFLAEEKRRRELLGLRSDEEEDESLDGDDGESEIDDESSATQDQDDEDEEGEEDDPVIDFADPDWEINNIRNRDRSSLVPEEKDRGDKGDDALVYDSNSEDELDVLEDSASTESKSQQRKNKFLMKSQPRTGQDEEVESDLEEKDQLSASNSKSFQTQSKSDSSSSSHLTGSENPFQKAKAKSAPTSSTSQYSYIPPKWLAKRRKIQDLLDSDLLDGSMIPYDIPGLKELLIDENLRKPFEQGGESEVEIGRSPGGDGNEMEQENRKGKRKQSRMINECDDLFTSAGSSAAAALAKGSIDGSSDGFLRLPSTSTSTSGYATEILASDSKSPWELNTPLPAAGQIARSAVKGKGKEKTEVGNGKSRRSDGMELASGSNSSVSPSQRQLSNAKGTHRSSNFHSNSSSSASSHSYSNSSSSSNSSSTSSISSTSSSTHLKLPNKVSPGKSDLNSSVLTSTTSPAPFKPSTKHTSSKNSAKLGKLKHFTSDKSPTTPNSFRSSKSKSTLTPTPTRKPSATKSKTNFTDQSGAKSSPRKSETPTAKRKRKLNLEEEEEESEQDESNGGFLTSNHLGSSPCGNLLNKNGKAHGGGKGEGKCSKAFCFTCLSSDSPLL